MSMLSAPTNAGCFAYHYSDYQLRLVIRAMYSNPPIHGARIVAKVLTDPRLKPLWYTECKAMADR
jgi:aspartate aminotransferase